MTWYFKDWRTDSALAICSALTRGVWFEWLQVMYEQDRYELSGDIATFAKWGRCTLDEVKHALDELHDSKAAEVTFSLHVTDRYQSVTLMSRRLKRDDDERKYNADKMKRWRESKKDKSVTSCNPPCNQDVTLPAVSSSVAVAVPSSKKKQPCAETASARASYPPEFEAFWKAYPASKRKVSKRKCFEAWKRKGIIKNGLLEQVMSALAQDAASRSWRDGYEPMPLTWLNQERWDRDLSETVDRPVRSEPVPSYMRPVKHYFPEDSE